MAEEISDDRFKSEVLRFIEIANQKLDGLTADVRTNSFNFDKLEATTNSRFDRTDDHLEAVSDKLNLIAKQFTAVTGKVIENEERLVSLESRVSGLEGETH